MLKKIVLGTLLVGLIGVLVAGGLIRTIDKTAQVAEARGSEGGQGHGNGAQVGNDCDQEVQGNGRSEVTSGGQGRGDGNGQGAGAAGDVERQYPNYEDPPEAWDTYGGTVVEAPIDGAELIIKTDAGEEISVGTGPGYMEAQGFSLQAGEQVQVMGYWEDGEFKAAQITRLQDGQTITLRDQQGRPAWAGGGRSTVEQQATAAQGSPGQGGYGGEGRTDTPGDGTGTGQAQVDEWLTLQGTVTSVDSAALVVRTSSGEEIVLDGRTWSFAQEQNFSAQVGDTLSLVGFYEDGDFEVGQIQNGSSGQVVDVRDASGRPLWAGQGRRGG